MKVRYEFVNGEWSEFEVEDSLGELLVELDRQEYNSGHKETRRHTSLDGMDYEGALFTAPTIRRRSWYGRRTRRGCGRPWRPCPLPSGSWCGGCTLKTRKSRILPVKKVFLIRRSMTV